MYALRKTGASITVLADQTDSTYWSDQVTFGLEEGQYMIGAQTPSFYNDVDGAVTEKGEAGINSYAFKLMLGDWIYINDPFNNVRRLVSPQGFVAGVLANLSPEGSSLNKPLSGVVATQKTAENQIYSDTDLSVLQTGGIDVITRPIPASAISFGCRIGCNTSSNVLTNGDNYTRLTNFIALTLETGLGSFIGLPQNLTVRAQAKATIQSFLQNLVQLNMIGTLNASAPFTVILDNTNNPPDRVALGFMQADVTVAYFAIILDFVVNFQANQAPTATLVGTRSVF
jgi:uncharacterized protein